MPGTVIQTAQSKKTIYHQILGTQRNPKLRFWPPTDTEIADDLYIYPNTFATKEVLEEYINSDRNRIPHQQWVLNLLKIEGVASVEVYRFVVDVNLEIQVDIEKAVMEIRKVLGEVFQAKSASKTLNN